MSLFKKVMIIGLATMALGTAAMGDPVEPGCTGQTDQQQKPKGGDTGGKAAVPATTSGDANGGH